MVPPGKAVLTMVGRDAVGERSIDLIQIRSDQIRVSAGTYLRRRRCTGTMETGIAPEFTPLREITVVQLGSC